MGAGFDNSEADGKVLQSFPESGPRVLWEVDVNAGFGGAAIVGDEVFHLDRVDQEFDILYCLDLKTGKEKWSWKKAVPGRISHPGARGVPTVTDDAVYVTSGFGGVYCIDRKTQKERWVVEMAKRFDAEPPRFGWAGHPIVKDGLCYLAPLGEKVGLAALDAKTGKTIWTSETVGNSHSSPLLMSVLGKEVLVMPGDFGREELVILGVAPKTGKTVFRYTEDFGSGIFNAIPNLLMLGEDRAIFTGGYRKGTWLLRFEKEGDKMKVEKVGKLAYGAKFHAPLVIGGSLYMTADKARGKDMTGLVSLSPTGETNWGTGKEPQLNGGSLINVGGTIISQDGDTGELRLIKAGKKYLELGKAKVFSKKTGKELWAPMAFSDGKLVMRSQYQLICVDLGLE
ncbi:MAG: outer membrane protein assembly factor BamB [Akkermansiaceae bacterium]|jgi:outer membrane protein assembly factor BamB